MAAQGDARVQARVGQRKATNARVIANTAIFTAFVAAVTMAFAIYIPATKGYFDIGEIMVYTTAMLMGPYVGAFAGGVGSSISDAILAPQYAPGTLVIKATEGFLVGYLTKSGATRMTRWRWWAASAVMGAILSTAIALIGVTWLSGPQQLYLGFDNGPNALAIGPLVIPANATIGPQVLQNFYVPSYLWVVIGAATFIMTVVAGLKLDPTVGWTILAVLVGGAAMVTGYFLYESIALQLGYITASVEVPINVGQVLVGLVVSIPVVRSIRRVSGGRHEAGGIEATTQ